MNAPLHLDVIERLAAGLVAVDAPPPLAVGAREGREIRLRGGEVVLELEPLLGAAHVGPGLAVERHRVHADVVHDQSVQAGEAKSVGLFRGEILT